MTKMHSIIGKISKATTLQMLYSAYSAEGGKFGL